MERWPRDLVRVESRRRARLILSSEFSDAVLKRAQCNASRSTRRIRRRRVVGPTFSHECNIPILVATDLVQESPTGRRLGLRSVPILYRHINLAAIGWGEHRG